MKIQTPTMVTHRSFCQTNMHILFRSKHFMYDPFSKRIFKRISNLTQPKTNKQTKRKTQKCKHKSMSYGSILIPRKQNDQCISTILTLSRVWKVEPVHRPKRCVKDAMQTLRQYIWVYQMWLFRSKELKEIKDTWPTGLQCNPGSHTKVKTIITGKGRHEGTW